MKHIRVLVVDDSGFIRNALSSIISKDPELDVVGLASDGIEAVEMAEKLRPDIITLDINMPKMNGLEALGIIMKKSPTAVLMVSSLTEEGAHATMEALDKGALDFISKSLGDSPKTLLALEKELLAKLKSIVRHKSEMKSRKVAVKKDDLKITIEKKKVGRAEIVAIGTSTGGPKALMDMMPLLPGNIKVGGVIVQHMPKSFIPAFAERVNQQSKVDVKVAEDGEELEPGCFLIAPSDYHMKLYRAGKKRVRIKLDPEPSNTLHRPNVNETFFSIAKTYPGSALGVILTGMGHDGLEGAKAMKESKCSVVAQDEESCVIYGMPRAIVEADLADWVLPLSKIHSLITMITSK